jgi:hypothetical protein
MSIPSELFITLVTGQILGDSNEILVEEYASFI